MTGRRVALLVATSEHIDQSLREPRAPSGDGRRLRELLLDPRVGAFDEVVIVANESKAGIEREAERLLRDRLPEDTVVLLLTGRAFLNQFNHLFFATVGTDVSMPYSTAVPSLVLWHMLYQSPAGVKLLLLDCAIDFPLTLSEYFGDSAYTFSAANQLTATLVRGLETGAADLDGDGRITVTELSRYLEQNLPGGGFSGSAGQFDVDTPIAHGRARTIAPVAGDLADAPAPAPEPADAPAAAAPPPDRPGPDLVRLLGLASVADFDPRQAWRRRAEDERYRIPVGAGEDGQRVELDLKMGPMAGAGPHGLVAGAPGSGKSEFLRTVVLGLAATHATEAATFLLVDFGDGTTFHGLDALPQVSATLTGIAGDQRLVLRLQDALAGEVARRQELLRAAGNFRNVWDYERARENGADLDPLPALFVVIDEFTAVLAARPGFRDVLVMLGRVGVTLGVHLLLAAAQPDEELLRALDARLTYRVGLRGVSPAVLGVPDAAELPPEPGAAYLKTDTGLVRFTAASASQPVAESPDTPSSVLEHLVGKMTGQAPPAPEVWLPPLDQSYPLDTMLAALNPVPDRGLSPVNSPWVGRLQTPVGVVDKPFEQRRELLWTDFSGPAGHGAVVGAPGSGKSMLLRTLVLSLALTHTPLEAQFHCVDLGGGTLAALSELPHVGAVVSAPGTDLAQRVVTELTALVTGREQRFRDQGIDSMAAFRERRRDKRGTGDQFGDVFLVVDGWEAFGEQFPELVPPVLDLVARGLAYGVHVILSARRWTAVPPETKDLIGTRFELRLEDPAESASRGPNAAHVPAGRPGSGLTAEGLHFLAALPRVDGSTRLDDVDAGVKDATDKIRQNWHGQVAPLARATRYVGVSRRYQIGVQDAEPVHVDFDTDPHLLVYGDSGSGKSNVLRTIVRAVTRDSTDKEALFMLVDYRRAMLGYVDTPHLLRYAMSPAQVNESVPDVVASLRKRLPSPEVTPEQLKARSWWTGPELYLVVDDYEMVSTVHSNPLEPLRSLLPQGHEIGLHLVVARFRSPGKQRIADSVIDTLDQLKTPVVLLGETEDGSGPPLPPPHAVLSDRAGRRPIKVTWTDRDGTTSQR